MALGVQYRGLPTVIEAVQNMKLSKWAIFYGKMLNMKCEDADWAASMQLLQDYLKNLSKSNTQSIYTMCLYEDDVKKIKSLTECDYSFNFTLFSEDYLSEGQTSRREGYGRILDKLDEMEKKNAALELKIAQFTEEEEEEEAPNTLESKIGALLDKPEVQNRLFALFDRISEPIINSVFPTTKNLAAAMGNVTKQHPQLVDHEQPVTTINLSQEQIDKVAAAVTILAAVDEKLGDHLMTLAELAKNNPKKYKSLIPMLNTFL